MKEREQWSDWDALAAGALDPADVQRLQRQAEEVEELRARWEAFRPLDEELRAKIARDVEHRTSAGASPPLAGRRRSLWIRPPAIVGAVALAAALLLSRLPDQPVEVVGPPIITSTLSRGEQAYRGSPDDHATEDLPAFRPSTALAWNLRPDQARPGVEAECFLEVDGEREAWTPPVQLGERGGVLIQGPAGALLGERRGLVTLGVVLRWPDGARVERRERIRVLDVEDP